MQTLSLMTQKTRSQTLLSASIAAGTMLACAASASSVQASSISYIGSAYDVDLDVANILGVGVGGVTLPTAGSSTPITSSLASVNLGVAAVSLAAGNLTTGIATSSTVGSNGFVDSKATVNGLDLPVSAAVFGVGDTITLYATTLQSETTATYSSGIAAGSSTIEGLYYVDDGTRVNVNVTGAANQVVTTIPGLAELIINEQTFDAGDDSLTTNALDVRTSLNTGVIIASSTAGYAGQSLTGAAAPEPGSLALLGALIPGGFLGLASIRRRRRVTA